MVLCLLMDCVVDVFFCSNQKAERLVEAMLEGLEGLANKKVEGLVEGPVENQSSGWARQMDDT